MAALREMGPTEMQGSEIATFSGAVAQRVALAREAACVGRKQAMGACVRLRRFAAAALKALQTGEDFRCIMRPALQALPNPAYWGALAVVGRRIVHQL